jgi:hypothetical protein
MVTTAPGLKERLRDELRRYLVVSAYLYVCFGVLMLYEATQPQARGEHVWHLGVAIGKALIVGKFVLLGEAARVGERMRARTVGQRIVWRVLLLTVVLVVLTAVEEVIVGAMHGRSALQTLDEFFVRSWLATSAKTLLMLLILAPLVTIAEAARALGPGALVRLLRSGPHRAHDEPAAPHRRS